MNTRIIKETRSLLPMLCVTLLASVAPLLIWSRETAGGVGLGFFTMCCVVMGAGSFGGEYHWRTMPLLLAQPVSRRKIWSEKMLVLAGALALGLVFFWLCVPLPDKDSFWFLILTPFCVFCVAPYMALRIKNTLMAAVLTFGLPFGICGTLALVIWVFMWFFPGAGEWFHGICRAGFQDLCRFSPEAGRWFASLVDNDPYFLICVPAAIYCAICYRLGYRSFIKLQAVDAQAKEIALPARLEAVLAGPINRLLPRYRSPWTSLLRKELQIQKPAFVVGGTMFFLALLLALAWDVHHTETLAGVAAVPIVILVFVTPAITTAVSVAEERGWGVSEWQRALPASSRKQWTAKMLTVVFTSVLFGVAAPLLMWIADGWVFGLPIGPGPVHWNRIFLSTVPELVWGLLVAADFVVVYLFMLAIGVFCSSLCANAAKAIIMNIGLAVTSAALAAGTVVWLDMVLISFGASRPENAGHGSSLVPLVIGTACLLGLLVFIHHLARSNHRNGEPTPRRVWIQLVTTAVVIALGAIVPWVILLAAR